MNISGFEKIAPHLTHPLALVGFVVMLAFGIHTLIVRSKLLSKINSKDTGAIFKLLLWLGLLLVLAVLVLVAWNSYMEKEKVQAVNARQVAEKLLAPLQGQLQAKDEQIKALTEAITALSKTGAPAASINAALQELEQGHTAKAQAIFAEVLRSKEAEGQQANKEAAAAARHLGALAYMNNPKEALIAYQKAVQLDPDNAAGWNQLGHLFSRTGELAKAKEAYRKVLGLGESHQDKKEQAIALGNLGLVYATYGELNKAEQMHKKALELDQALGSKGGMAADYCNLGLLYFNRAFNRDFHHKLDYHFEALTEFEFFNSADLNQAEEMLLNSLELLEALDNKSGIASMYAKLGLVYLVRGDIDEAKRMYGSSLKLEQTLGHKEGIAFVYSQIGNANMMLNYFDKAEEMHKKALLIEESLGRKENRAVQYYNLGFLYDRRGDLDRAEEMYKKSLKISELMGSKADIANLYINLSIIYKKRGDLDQAKQFLQKSLRLYQEMGHPHAKMVQQGLDELAQRKANR